MRQDTSRSELLGCYDCGSGVVSDLARDILYFAIFVEVDREESTNWCCHPQTHVTNGILEYSGLTKARLSILDIASPTGFRPSTAG